MKNIQNERNNRSRITKLIYFEMIPETNQSIRKFSYIIENPQRYELTKSFVDESQIGQIESNELGILVNKQAVGLDDETDR